ncbi:MAG TPA: M14 metallopeptidase family protein [Vicinamibacterales bacterium]|nr:M14 metallopeptidase family protein [Vicinamibacterales bacterium]
MTTRRGWALSVLAVLMLAGGALRGQAPPRVTSPVDAFGQNFGDDYFLATYRQLAEYWRTLARESDRMTVQSIGPTSEGREQLMAIVTSPDNHRNLARYRDISRRLALAEGVDEADARQLAIEGKAVVWIDGGLHANEVLGAQQLGEMVYRIVSRNDRETLRILDDVIILFVHANPDGHDLVADWYMRHPDPAARTTAGLPRLYHFYIGHDNNRDFFASTQKETENINRVLYREWYPQLLYNHHQSGPAGTIVWSPPLRDPFNYNQDPLLVLGLQTVGLALHSRLAAEGKPGATMRSGGPYDGWWNGGIRNTAAFHNTIAILTEMIGSPTPMRVPLVMNRQVPTSDLTYPVAPQPWHFRQSVEYSVTTNMAVLDLASRARETVLFNRWVMGKNSIERGSRDTWTPAPHRYAAAEAELAARTGGAGAGGRGGRGGGRGAGVDEQALWAALHRPEHRDPRGYIIPSTQPDFATATRFVNALLETGITVHRATREFAVEGRTYPAGSYVVLTAQAFRPHVIDMFEPQDHPDNFPHPGAPPTPPYDSAGWTFAYQMGVEFDRVLEAFTGPFERLDDWNLTPPPGRVAAGTPAYYAADPVQLDAFRAASRLVAAGADVFRSPTGAFLVRQSPAVRAVVDRVAAEHGVHFEAATAEAGAIPLAAPRVGLWDRYGGSMPSGWTRWILEQFEIPFRRVFAQELDAGNLTASFDTLVFVDGAIPAGDGGAGGRGGGPPADVPAEYRDHVGQVTVLRTLPALRAFVDGGGTIVAIGSSAENLARHLDLAVDDHLVENGDEPLPRTRFYVPSSVLRTRVDTTHPVAAGLQAHTDVFYNNGPVWRLRPDAAAQGVRPIAWFDSPTPLRSGWAWGQQYLQHGVVAVEARVGRGRVLLFGAEILQRAQPHGTFKLLFNGIFTK